MPFVQGHLRQQDLTFTITTECAHCRAPIHLDVDTDLNFRIAETTARPLVFMPLVDFARLEAPSIIDDF